VDCQTLPFHELVESSTRETPQVWELGFQYRPSSRRRFKRTRPTSPGLLSAAVPVNVVNALVR